jgi:hypothetical protein
LRLYSNALGITTENNWHGRTSKNRRDSKSLETIG